MRNKFGAVRTTVDGVTFHSKREASYYLDLKRLLQARKITKLELQPCYPIIINGVKVCKVLFDFRYIQNGTEVIIDVKGHDTNLSKLKRKLAEAMYGIKVILI